jgi:imidazoleglycerol phosphate synthase glutamine amidotransferase subunit HisH
MGWNRIELADGEAEFPEPRSSARIIEPGVAYFANSFRVAEPPEGWMAATAKHGGRFVAGLERGGVVLCQFHPELSGAWGLGLIRRWISRGLEASAC